MITLPGPGTNPRLVNTCLITDNVEQLLAFYEPILGRQAKNKGMILEFQVGSLDQEYKRLQGHVKIWVKLPARTPWGTRSMYFRDPDGDLVDYYELPKAKN
jgi:uncharacterized glyoxalase superfamily protein PhnB